MSMYFAKVIMTRVAHELKAGVQRDMMKSFVSSDTKFINKAHTGKFISNLTVDVSLIIIPALVVVATVELSPVSTVPPIT